MIIADSRLSYQRNGWVTVGFSVPNSSTGSALSHQSFGPISSILEVSNHAHSGRIAHYSHHKALTLQRPRLTAILRSFVHVHWRPGSRSRWSLLAVATASARPSEKRRDFGIGAQALHAGSPSGIAKRICGTNPRQSVRTIGSRRKPPLKAFIPAKFRRRPP